MVGLGGGRKTFCRHRHRQRLESEEGALSQIKRGGEFVPARLSERHGRIRKIHKKLHHFFMYFGACSQPILFCSIHEAFLIVFMMDSPYRIHRLYRALVLCSWSGHIS